MENWTVAGRTLRIEHFVFLKLILQEETLKHWFNTYYILQYQLNTETESNSHYKKCMSINSLFPTHG